MSEKTYINTFVPEGLDLSSAYGKTAEGKSPYMINLWKNYEDTAFSGFQTRPGMSLFKTFVSEKTPEKPSGGSFYTVPFGDGYVYKMGGSIYYSEEKGPLVTGLPDEAKSPEETAFRYALFNNSIYIYEALTRSTAVYVLTFKNGKITTETVEIDSYSWDSKKLPEEYYAPTVLTGLNARGVGNKNLPFNLLSPYYSLEYKVEETEDGGTVLSYKVPTKGVVIAVDYTDVQGYEHKLDYDFTFSLETRTLIFGGIKKNTGFKVYMRDIKRFPERDRVLKMKKFTVFDNRVFAAVTESDEDKNRLLWSRAENPFYFADTDFVTDGQGGECVTDLLPVGQYLSVFKKDRSEKNGIYLHYPTATQNELVPKVYPSVYGLYDVGVLNKNSAVNVNDNCLFLSRNGLNSLVGTDLNKVSTVEHRSSYIDARLISELKENTETARLLAFHDYVVISLGDLLYLGDTKQSFIDPETGNRELNWYKWYNVRPEILSENGEKRTARLLQLFEDNEGLLCALFYEENYRWLVRFDDFREEREDVCLSLSEAPTEKGFPLYSALATAYMDFGFPDRRKKSLRHRGFATVEGEDVRLFSKTDWEKREEPLFLNRAEKGFDPYVKTDGGREVTGVKRKGINLYYDLYTKDFLSLSVLFSSLRPLRFYRALNGAKIREKER